ncbi:hypothetical protein ACO0LL_08030 [Undibacterium sp. TC4M20W]|uniref:hypothetical protein n=1 Tax=Undibacterium sp. TC4M20W TaxID=3413052 RepID=UPI003BF1C1D6
MSLNKISFQKPVYTYADLSTFGGQYSFANAINDAGQMIGSDTKSESGNSHSSSKYGVQTTYAVLWDNSYYVPKTSLLADVESHAYGINNLSDIVGSSLKEVNGSFQTTATIWQDGKTNYLASLSDGLYKSSANAINDKGVVVGNSFTGNSWDAHHATLWNDKGVIDLGTLGGTDSNALAINNDGVIAGWASGAEPSDYTHPVIWKDGNIINLSPTHHGAADSINDSGMVVGYILDDEMYAHPVLWNNQKETIMQSTAGSFCYASAINNKNQVVGSEISANGQFHALLWNTPDSAPVDLNQFLDQSQRDAGWTLANALDINDKGWIVGSAMNTRTYETHAFVLTADGITGLTGARPVQVIATAAPASHVASADIWSMAC